MHSLGEVSTRKVAIELAPGRCRGLAAHTDDPLAWYARVMERLDEAS
jgi:hypothetical protein